MDSENGIRLNPDVTEGKARGETPLSDLYNLPVFTADTEQKERECHTEEKQVLEHIRQGIFQADGQGEEERLEHIYSQVFMSPSEIVIPKTAEKTAEKTETAYGTWVFLEMTAAGLMVLLLWIQKICRRKLFERHTSTIRHKGKDVP